MTLLSGCAHNTSIPYQSFERIEIIALDSRTSTDTGPSRGETIAAGAFGGLMASFLTSLACGPYFPLCFTAAAPATIGATAVFGGAMGMSAISDADAARIIPKLVKVYGKNVELSLTVATEYEWGLNKPGSQHATLSFRCNTRSWPFDEWVNDNDVTVEKELDYCIEDLAGQITRVLTKPPPMPVDGFPELDV